MDQVIGEIPKKEKKESFLSKRMFKLFLLPIITSIIFCATIAGLVLPKISNDILPHLEEVNKLEKDLSDKKDEIQDLNILIQSSSTLTKNLEIINAIAPTGSTQVVEFRNKITKLAQTNELKVTSQRLTDSQVNSPDVQANTIRLSEIPTLFELNGKFANIEKFISALSSIDDFLIITELNLSLSKQSDSVSNPNAEWSLQINLAKYQFVLSKNESEIIETFKSVPFNAALSPEIESYIKLKTK